MGARGPAPTPTALLEARGSWRAKRNQAEPKPPAGPPKCPRTLKGEARKIWRPLVAMLEKMRLVTIADGAQLERYCVYLARWRQCEAFIAEHGMTYPVKGPADATSYMGHVTTAAGAHAVLYFEEYPQLKESHRLDKALKQIEANFGLTPSARARLQLEDEQPAPVGKDRFFPSSN